MKQMKINFDHKIVYQIEAWGLSWIRGTHIVSKNQWEVWFIGYKRITDIGIFINGHTKDYVNMDLVEFIYDLLLW